MAHKEMCTGAALMGVGGPEHLQARKRGGMELIQFSDPPGRRPAMGSWH